MGNVVLDSVERRLSDESDEKLEELVSKLAFLGDGWRCFLVLVSRKGE